mmetsp:Transcript_1187/g.7773  ORF Transcript_1187/g.7773 Transcript_1187/m.7773 type:complete len:83 (-) Transcript_1187:776-1024(-)
MFSKQLCSVPSERISSAISLQHPEERERHRRMDKRLVGVARDAMDKKEHAEDEAVEHQGKGWERKAAPCERAPMEQQIGMRV